MNMLVICPVCRKRCKDSECSVVYFPCCSEKCGLIEQGLVQREPQMVHIDREELADHDPFNSDIAVEEPYETSDSPSFTEIVAHANNFLTASSGALPMIGTNHTQILHEVMPTIFRRAIRHVESVIPRANVKATERVERVGHFVTSLKRYIDSEPKISPPMAQTYKGILCDKTSWYDVGEPEANATIHCPGYFGHSDVLGWLAAAEYCGDPEDEAVEDAKALLEEVKRDLASLGPLNRRTDVLAIQTQSVATKLESLIQQCDAA